MKEIFAPAGPLASRIPDYEIRQQQVAMAEAVARALTEPHHLIVEAGTGVGKTLAYLVPLLLSGTSAVVSTATKVLQHQLLEKDIPLAVAATGTQPEVAILKGRSNYLCLLRLEQMRVQPLFEATDEIPVWEQVDAWTPHTGTGDFEELEEVSPGNRLLQRLNADRNFCTGTRCPHLSECFFYKARKAAMKADIVLVNHHLLFSDLSVKQTQYGAILPPHPVLIADEAHRLEDIASAQFGEAFTPRMVGVFLAQLPADLKVKYAVRLKEALSGEILDAIQPVRQGRQRLTGPMRQHLEGLIPIFREIGSALQGIDEGELELKDNLLTRIEGFLLFLKRLSDDEMVATVEREGAQVRFRTIPIDISSRIRESLEAHFETVIMTSATLSVRRSTSFFRDRVGLTEGQELLLASPFPFAENTRIYVPRDIPDVNDPAFLDSATPVVRELLAASNGRAFLLCTSLRHVREFARRLREDGTWNVLEQGEGTSSALVGRFMLEPRSVLVGSLSFWEGVDVKGDMLSLIIMDRLPFNQPTDPVYQARANRLENPFMRYALPLAVLQFKQGMGRLIRSGTDRGIYAILDNRIVRKRYGRTFLNSFYPVPVTHDIEEVKNFLADR